MVAVIRSTLRCKGKISSHPPTLLMHSSQTSPRKPPTSDPDNMILRTGNRAPWASLTPSLGVPKETGTPLYVDVLPERRQLECVQGYDNHDIQLQVQLVVCTARDQVLYICTEQTGADWQVNRPLTATYTDPDTAAAAAVRLSTALFPWHKTIHRAVQKAVRQSPYTFTAVSPQGNSTRTTQWGVRLSAEAAVSLPPPQKITDATRSLSDPLVEQSRTKWMARQTLIDSLKTQPFSGAELKGIVYWSDQLFSKWINQKNDIEATALLKNKAMEGANDRAATRLPHQVSRWLYGETDKAWAMNDTHSPSLDKDTLPRLVASAQRLPQTVCEIKKLQLTVNMARERAQANGCNIISARDLIESAQALQYETRHGGPRPTPADQPPQHYCNLQLALARLADVNAQNAATGVSRPWVLVCCERSAIISRHFQMAGFQVASCDLADSEDQSGQIPHYKGNCCDILHLGFDLIIGCPPCTFLSNCSVPWLHVEPHRWVSMREAALLFRQIYNAPNCPFVVLENPVMSKYGRQLLDGLRPSYFTHPASHGHDSSKPIPDCT